MSAKDTTEKGNAKAEAEAGTKAPQGFDEMCRRMMSGGMPDCCGPEMQGMMSRWMAGFRPETKD